MTALSLLLTIAALHQTDGAEASLVTLRDRAQSTRLTFLAPAKGEPQFVPAPVFRYTDELRHIEDAGIWVWTLDGRPQAAMKVERYPPKLHPSRWLYCFTSLSSHLMRAEWDGETPYQTKQPGVRWQTLSEMPANSRPARLIQMREIARRFQAELISKPDGSNRSQMRLLSRPMYRYPDELADRADGAMFGFSGTGTNPDLLLLLDFTPGEGWRFGFAGMTAEGVTVRLGDKNVWEIPHTSGKGNVFDTWVALFSKHDGS